jgi:hypothetical protein
MLDTASETDSERNGAFMRISGSRGFAENQERRGYNRDVETMQEQFPPAKA